LRRTALLSVVVVFTLSLACGGAGGMGGTSSSGGTSVSTSVDASAGPWKDLGLPMSDAATVTATDSALAITWSSGTIESHTEDFAKALEAKGFKRTSDVGDNTSGRVVSLQKDAATISLAVTTQGSTVVLAATLTGSL
jgi:hypothetical protein